MAGLSRAEVRRLIALALTRAAAGFGGALAGMGLVHIVSTGNPWGIGLLAGGLGLLLYGVRHAARLAEQGAAARRGKSTTPGRQRNTRSE